MPLIHVNVPEGALDQERKSRLVDRLTREVLKVEGAPETAAGLEIAWLFLNEVTAGAWAIAGTSQGVADGIRYLVQVTVPKGSLNDDRKKLMVETVTRVIADVEGVPTVELSPQRVWCMINEVPDGNWGAGGHIFRFVDIARAAGVDTDSAEFRERMREAVAPTA